ncbi:MAG TPA: ABC transporter permease [Acidimicrobiales bacterium]|nr:ABC transporter permease [Acidimicrobiales bacterium]
MSSEPPAELLFRRRIGPRRALRELWAVREVVVSLAQRDFLVRYKQTFLGVLWAVFAPLTLVLVFSLVFERVADVSTGGAPYALFAYLGLLPWTFLSTSLSQGGLSLEANRHLLNRVAFPREVFPLATVAAAAVDLLIASSVLAVLFVAYGVAPRPTSFWAPLLFAVQLAFVLGVALVASVGVVYARDLRHLIPIVLQIGLFATPVAYGMEAIPSGWRLAYSVVNPMAAVIDGLRRTVLWGSPPRWDLLAAASLGAAAVLVGGYVLFKRLETGLADIA